MFTRRKLLNSNTFWRSYLFSLLLKIEVLWKPRLWIVPFIKSWISNWSTMSYMTYHYIFLYTVLSIKFCEFLWFKNIFRIYSKKLFAWPRESVQNDFKDSSNELCIALPNRVLSLFIYLFFAVETEGRSHFLLKTTSPARKEEVEEASGEEEKTRKKLTSVDGDGDESKLELAKSAIFRGTPHAIGGKKLANKRHQDTKPAAPESSEVDVEVDVDVDGDPVDYKPSHRYRMPADTMVALSPASGPSGVKTERFSPDLAQNASSVKSRRSSTHSNGSSRGGSASPSSSSPAPNKRASTSVSSSVAATTLLNSLGRGAFTPPNPAMTPPDRFSPSAALNNNTLSSVNNNLFGNKSSLLSPAGGSGDHPSVPMVPRNYSDYIRSLAAKYNNSNPNEWVKLAFLAFDKPKSWILVNLNTGYSSICIHVIASIMNYVSVNSIDINYIIQV